MQQQGSMKKKRTYASSVRDRYILNMYNKMHELASMLADLVSMQLLTDTTILHISNLGVVSFFVENIPELQLTALKLVTNLFSKYEKHRKLLLVDILYCLPAQLQAVVPLLLAQLHHPQPDADGAGPAAHPVHGGPAQEAG